MPKLGNKQLGMETAGFNPLDHFPPEQVEKMRNMKPEDKHHMIYESTSVSRETKKKLKMLYKETSYKTQTEFIDYILKLGMAKYEEL